MIVKLTESQIETLEYLLEKAKATLPEDYPNDPDVRRNLQNKYERIENIFDKELRINGFRGDPFLG